jgi:tetratricopeptide (TPR) repeat protein
LRDFDGALLAAGELKKLGDTSEDWQVFEGHVLARQGQFRAAIAHFTRAIAQPDAPPTYYRFRALAHLCLGEYAQAVDDYATGINLRGTESLWERYQRATTLWILGRHAEAAADYRTVRDWRGHVSYADARLFLVLRDQGRCLRQQGRNVAADKVTEQAQAAFVAARGGVPPGSWLAKIFGCLAGESTPDQLMQTADPNSVVQRCEGAYYAGEVCLLNGRPAAARKWFQMCVDTGLIFDPNSDSLDPMNEFHLARWRLRQLTADADSEGTGVPDGG